MCQVFGRGASDNSPSYWPAIPRGNSKLILPTQWQYVRLVGINPIEKCPFLSGSGKSKWLDFRAKFFRDRDEVEVNENWRKKTDYQAILTELQSTPFIADTGNSF